MSAISAVNDEANVASMDVDPFLPGAEPIPDSDLPGDLEGPEAKEDGGERFTAQEVMSLKVRQKKELHCAFYCFSFV